MTVRSAFRLSLYLSIGLACLCLGYAELEFLPEATPFALITLATVAAAYYLEGRWSLSLRSANLVGLLVGGALGVWVAYQYARPGSLIHTLPWPTGLVPYFGPILMVAMAAKLLRPKDAGDHWALHLIALVMVGLACAMAEDFVFGVLLVAYLACAVWSLTLFYFDREGHSEATAEQGRIPWLRRGGLWTAIALTGALTLFLITPRSPGQKWNMHFLNQTSMEIGYSGDETVDLNRSGTLEANSEIAFRARITNPLGRPRQRVSTDIYWKGKDFGSYTNGVWRAIRARDNYLVYPEWSAVQPPVDPTRLPETMLPDFGPGSSVISFHPERANAAAVLASPIWWEPGKAVPVVTIGGTRRERGPWFIHTDGTFSPRSFGIDSDQTYRQVVPELEDTSVGPPMVLRMGPASLTYLDGVSAALRDWTDDLIARLRREGRWAAGDEPLAVARTLSDHLANSGEFRYSLELPRKDRAIDPIEDFLFNTRQGHCNRFATALVLMARSQGIPARLSVGYFGAEVEGGELIVRESHAHAWAEVLVEGPAPNGFARRGVNRVWRWVRLDPSPAVDDPMTSSNWWQNARDTGKSFFEEYIVGYNADRRKATASALTSWFTRAWASASASITAGEPEALLVMAGVFLLIGTALGAVLRARRRPARPAVHPVYSRLLVVLARHGLVPDGPGSTPREFADAVTRRLGQRPALASFAGLPGDVIEVYYRDRFAGQAAEPARLAELSGRIASLDLALKRAGA